MKSFTVYRNIRRKALIFGLVVSSFAIQMGSVIASLLLIIFSFKLLLLFALMVFNLGLYVSLLRLGNLPFAYLRSGLPLLISNRRTGISHYYEH